MDISKFFGGSPRARSASASPKSASPGAKGGGSAAANVNDKRLGGGSPGRSRRGSVSLEIAPSPSADC